MPYNFVADSIHTKKLCSRLSSSEMQFQTETAVWQRTMLIMLIGKHVVDFLLVLIELFSLVLTVETLRANIDWKSAFLLEPGQLDPKFQVEGVAPSHSSCQKKNRMNDLSCSIRMLAQVSFVLFQSTCLTDRQTDRETGERTDGQKGLGNTMHCISCSRTVKIHVAISKLNYDNTDMWNYLSLHTFINHYCLKYSACMRFFNCIIHSRTSGIYNHLP